MAINLFPYLFMISLLPARHNLCKKKTDLEIRKLLLSFVPVFILLEEVSEDVKSRAVQIAGHSGS
jgi:hypothetical protein